MHDSECTKTHWIVHSKRISIMWFIKKFKGENLGLGLQRISYHNY